MLLNEPVFIDNQSRSTISKLGLIIFLIDIRSKSVFIHDFFYFIVCSYHLCNDTYQYQKEQKNHALTDLDNEIMIIMMHNQYQ